MSHYTCNALSSPSYSSSSKLANGSRNNTSIIFTIGIHNASHILVPFRLSIHIHALLWLKREIQTSREDMPLVFPWAEMSLATTSRSCTPLRAWPLQCWWMWFHHSPRTEWQSGHSPWAMIMRMIITSDTYIRECDVDPWGDQGCSTGSGWWIRHTRIDAHLRRRRLAPYSSVQSLVGHVHSHRKRIGCHVTAW